MKTAYLKYFFAVSFSAILISCNPSNEDHSAYLGQPVPDNSPIVFAPGIISTGENELNSVFACNGKEFYFSRGDLSKNNRLFMTTRKDNNWSTPTITPFTNSVDPHFTPDCKRIYYASKGDIVFADRMADGSWSDIRNAGENVNSSSRELYPCVVEGGSLYFQSSRPGGMGKSDIYRAQYQNGNFLPAENIGNTINTEYGEGDVYTAPDESFIIFNSSGRPDSYGSGDLYISFRQNNGSWSVPQNMGSNINSPELEYCPMMSDDGKYFFYTSRINNGQGDIFWVNSDIIQAYR